MTWRRLSKASVEQLLDFSGGRTGDPQWGEIARRQLDGAVALYNRLADRRVAWLADEVGMGKTYVALGVIALVRHLQPRARVLVLVPSSRLQPKWRMEIARFTRDVVRVVDHRARTLQDTPGRRFHEPHRLHDLGALLAADPDVDLLAPLSAFSLGLSSDPRSWRDAWNRLAQVAPALPEVDRALLRPDRKEEFKRDYAGALNTLLPEFDLVVVDESHNLKHGFSGPSSRNQTLAVALGGLSRGLRPELAALVRPKVRRLLCLSATPVERDYDQLVRQAELFGLGRVPGLELLDDPDAAQEVRRDRARQFVIRRLNRLAVAGRSLTKNLYRREWRWGGVDEHDREMRVESDLDRLVLALVQKKVTEVLHHTDGRRSDGTFLRSFQMGMLSSFESFSQTIQGRLAGRAPPTADEEDDEEGAPSHFDAHEQTHDPHERLGVDTHVVDALCASFRDRFGRGLPHPKMDQVARAVDRWMADGEKSLVFVRRIKTVEELAGKIARAYDLRLFDHLKTEIPEALAADLTDAIESYRRNQVGRGPLASDGLDDDDEGGADTFFSWYFRGDGRERARTGAWFRRQQLQTASSRWSTFFHDNPIRRLIGPELPAWVRQHRDWLAHEARFAFGRDPSRWGYRFEAWQAAALELLSRDHTDPDVRREARWLRHELYPSRTAKPVEGEIGDPEVLLAEETLFTVLAQHELGPILWPRSGVADESAWHEREVRRELLASAIRLGHPIVDLWLTAVRLTRSLDGSSANEVSPGELARAFLARLSAAPVGAGAGPRGWSRRELAALAEHHHLIVSLNFPDLPRKDLRELNRVFQAVLSRQAPVLGMHGSSKSEQAIKQFRMPGYPYAIVTTDILQEGVDLHTFCARVLHYGITHTSSGTEQRTGRVDRIGSLVQRRLDASLADHDKLQVHYPHLLDTVEPLQVQVLYERMDQFVRLLHEGLGAATREESRVALDRGLRDAIRYPAPIATELRSSFEVDPKDLDGDDFVVRADTPYGENDLREWLTTIGRDGTLPFDRARAGVAFVGEAWLVDGELAEAGDGGRRQPFRVAIESRRDGGGLRLRIVSPIGAVSLRDGRTAGAVLRAQEEMWGGVVMDSGDGEGTLAVRADVPLEPGGDVVARLRDALVAVLSGADQLEQWLLGPEVDASLEDMRSIVDSEDTDDAE